MSALYSTCRMRNLACLLIDNAKDNGLSSNADVQAQVV